MQTLSAYTSERVYAKQASRLAANSALVVFVVFALLYTVSVSFASASEAPRDATASLPAPFRFWNVRLEPRRGDPRVLDLAFDSPLLHRRVINRVYLPTGYDNHGAPWPVMYYLHGASPSQLNNRVVSPLGRPLSAALQRAHVLYLVSLFGAGAGTQADLFGFDREADRARFVVVAPDTSNTEPFCQTCMWLDGQQHTTPDLYPATAHTIPADSFLHKELYPLVEALLHVRHDRGGRGVMGLSMGGVDAYQQAMLHPDQYAFAASVSGALDTVNDPALRAIWEYPGFMRDQGYGTGFTNGPDWRGRNPLDLVTNLEGADLSVLSAVGDGCLSPSSLNAPDCRAHPAVTNADAAAVEVAVAHQYAMNAHTLRDHGIDETRAQYPGVHAANCHTVYQHSIVVLANAVFARTVTDPTVFRYRSVMRSFSIWGYHVTVDRRQTEFLDITNAHRDGREFTLRGHGIAHIHTPDRFQPGRTYQITTSSITGTSSRIPVRADSTGRLDIPVDLSHATLPGQLINQFEPADLNLTTPAPLTIRVH